MTILDCWTIAWVILLTWIFLGTKYSWWQFFGAAICLAGLGLVLLSDAHEGGEGTILRPFLRKLSFLTLALNTDSLLQPIWTVC